MLSSVNKKSTPELILLAQKGNIKALEALIRREQKHIYAMFSHLVENKQDNSDLTQDVLLKMAKNIAKLSNIENFRAWLNKIIANTYNDYVKKNYTKYVEIDETKLNEIKDKIGCEPGERCLFAEIEKLIQSAVLSLPRNLRLSIVLREYEGLSYEDISKITNTTLGTVKSRIARARMKLQEELKEYI